ncbi:MAG: efflux transporter outer membrane subunit [Bacteroidetes bacterium]|nr:efflux transporter outer membrane subunit [Bacteroidota bacterium]
MVLKNYKIISSCILVILLIAGCKIGPNYKQPQYDLGKNYRFAKSADTLSLADTSWSYLFTDPVLKALIKKGLENNFDLKIAVERVNQATASFKEARAAIWPSIGAEANGSLNTIQTPLAGGNTTSYNDLYAVGALSWELDVWGKLRRSKESARAQMLSQVAYRQSVYISLIAEIATAYFSLLDYRDEVEIARETVRIRTEGLELVRGKLLAGTVSGLTVAQAEAELAQVKAELPAYEKAAALQENALKLLLGELPGEIVAGDSITRQINPNIIPEAGIPSQLIVRRPDLIAAEQQLVSANAQIGVARGMMLPSLSINANAGYSTLGAGWIGSAVGSLVAPIFSFGKLRANLKRTQAYHEEILITYQKSIYTAISEVSDGIMTVEKQKEISVESRNLTNAAQTAFDLAYQLFNAGYASYLDVIDVQRQLYSAQINESQAHYAELSSVVNLYKALGGGWK